MKYCERCLRTKVIVAKGLCKSCYYIPYARANKDKINAKRREAYAKNRDAISERRRVMYAAKQDYE